MGMIKELYDFVSEKGLEMHTSKHEGKHTGLLSSGLMALSTTAIP